MVAAANRMSQFRNHSDWVSMMPSLENKTVLRQAVVPHSTPGDGPAYYEYDKKTFLLPMVDQKQFDPWGLDPQRFIEAMLLANPGRIKELSTSQMIQAAGKFAKLRFPGANLGLDQQFIKQVRDKVGVGIVFAAYKVQFGTSDGLAALLKHENERRAIIAEDRASIRTLTRNPAALTNELQRHWSGMFGKARKSEKEIYQGVIKREKEIIHGKPRQDPYQPGVISTDRSHDILRAHPLPEPHRARLASSGMALIVSLASLEEQAVSVTATHFHIHETEPEHKHIWVKLELLAAFHPAVVIPFDNVTIKERALAQLQHSSRFDFLEEKGLQLDAYTLREGIAKEPTFMLGSGPLKTLALLDESLRAFFWYKGYISNRDLITKQVRGITERKVVIRNNRGFDWVQKCTVTKAGNGDQNIPAESVEKCSICLGSRSRLPLVRENVEPNDRDIPRQVPKFPDRLRSVSASKMPARRGVVPNDRNAPKYAPVNQDKVRPVAPLPAPLASDLIRNDAKAPTHIPKTQLPANAAGIFQPIVLANTVANDDRGPISDTHTHRHARSKDAFQTPARASNAPRGVKAPSRKVNT